MYLSDPLTEIGERDWPSVWTHVLLAKKAAGCHGHRGKSNSGNSEQEKSSGHGQCFPLWDGQEMGAIERKES